MYAGTTFRRDSGRIVGVHQKIDRVARRHLNRHVSKSVDFPGIRDILHFEGKNGPDAIKRKSPSIDEPWHYIDPTNPKDLAIIEMINDHIVNLAEALAVRNEVRAAFEAAWLSHAIVDGLTPAHHYPLNDKIEELWGKSRHERLSVIDKNIIRGVNGRDTISKNWEYWGAGGVFTAHILFEMGVASIIASDNFENSGPTADDVEKLNVNGFEKLYMESIMNVFGMKLYDEFGSSGWTRKLASKVKKDLMPEIIKMVALAWYQAAELSKEIAKDEH